jgi:CRP-like cAMP-binding protein
MIGSDLKGFAHWLDGLESDAVERVRKGLSERSYKAGDYVCHRGDRLEFWTGVASGLIKISAISADGKAMTFAGIGSGGWFGEGTVLKKEARKYDLVALRDTRLLLLNQMTFDWLVSNSAAFNRFLVHQLNERMGQFIATIEYDRLYSPVARVARHIAWLCNPVLYPNAGRHIEIAQEELALLVGISRQAANKSLQELEQAGLLTMSRSGITVRDIAALGAYEG